MVFAVRAYMDGELNVPLWTALAAASDRRSLEGRLTLLGIPGVEANTWAMSVLISRCSREKAVVKRKELIACGTTHVVGGAGLAPPLQDRRLLDVTCTHAALEVVLRWTLRAGQLQQTSNQRSSEIAGP